MNYTDEIANKCAVVRGLRSHKFAVHGLGMDKPPQPAEGLLIKAGIHSTPGMTIRRLATEVDLSEARIRQYINGYASAGKEQYVSVDVPAERLANIAYVLDLSVKQLWDAGRGDASGLLEQRLEAEKAAAKRPPDSVGADDEAEFEFLTRVREDLTTEEMDTLMEELNPYLERLVRDIKRRRD